MTPLNLFNKPSYNEPGTPPQERIMDRQQYATLQRTAASLDARIEDTFREEKFFDNQTFLF